MSGVDGGSQRLELDVAEKEVLGCPIMKRPLDGVPIAHRAGSWIRFSSGCDTGENCMEAQENRAK